AIAAAPAGGTAAALAAIVVVTAAAILIALATAAAFAPSAEQRQLAAELAQHDLGGVAVLAALVLPFAGFQRALDIDRAALAQILLGDLAEVLVEDGDRMPFGAFLALARVAVAPGFRG